VIECEVTGRTLVLAARRRRLAHTPAAALA
jgi:hypothetical protein